MICTLIFFWKQTSFYGWRYRYKPFHLSPTTPMMQKGITEDMEFSRTIYDFYNNKPPFLNFRKTKLPFLFLNFEKRNSLYQSKSHFVFAQMTFCHRGEKDEPQQGFSYFSKSFSLSGIENHQKVSVMFRCFVVFVFSVFWKIKLPLSCKASFFTHSSSYSPASMLPVRNRILPRKNMLLQKFNILKNKTPFIKSKTKLPLSKNIA